MAENGHLWVTTTQHGNSPTVGNDISPQSGEAEDEDDEQPQDDDDAHQKEDGE